MLETRTNTTYIEGNKKQKTHSPNIVGFLLSEFFGRDEVLPQFYLVNCSNKNVRVCGRVFFGNKPWGNQWISSETFMEAAEVDVGWDGDDDAGMVCNQVLSLEKVVPQNQQVIIKCSEITHINGLINKKSADPGRRAQSSFLM